MRKIANFMWKTCQNSRKNSKLKVKTQKVGTFRIPGCRKSVQKKPDVFTQAFQRQASMQNNFFTAYFYNIMLRTLSRASPWSFWLTWTSRPSTSSLGPAHHVAIVKPVSDQFIILKFHLENQSNSLLILLISFAMLLSVFPGYFGGKITQPFESAQYFKRSC